MVLEMIQEMYPDFIQGEEQKFWLLCGLMARQDWCIAFMNYATTDKSERQVLPEDIAHDIYGIMKAQKYEDDYFLPRLC